MEESRAMRWRCHRYEDFFLGEEVDLLGRRLVVAGKESRLKNSQLVHTYRLCPASGCRVERIPCPGLRGAAIRGTVTETSLCSNRLSLETDMEGELLESWHRQPVYYAGGGKGYSGQLEPRDTQYLYFPTGREEERYIIGYVDAGEDRALLADDRARYTYDTFNRTETIAIFDGHVQINRYDPEGLRRELEEDGKLVQRKFNPEKAHMIFV